MKHPFETLAAEYTALLARMTIQRMTEVDAVARKLLGLVSAGRYDAACAATGVPKVVAAASFEREAASNFHLSPAQGDPWDKVSTHVPKGIGPFPNWAAAAIAAYKIDGLDRVGIQNWTWERACYQEELFNGMGYRAHGVHTPYLWAGTSIYVRGKYVADGRFDPSVADKQLGVIPVMKRMIDMNPSLALSRPFPGATAGAPAAGAAPGTSAPGIAGALPTPARAPEGLHSAAELQEALNLLLVYPKLLVDGSYGRRTRAAVIVFQKSEGLEADGVAGPKTWDAIRARLK